MGAGSRAGAWGQHRTPPALLAPPQTPPTTPAPSPPSPRPAPPPRRRSNASGNLPTSVIRRNMQKIMQNNAAVFRTQETLAEGCTLIDECADSFQARPLRGAGRAGGGGLVGGAGWRG